MLIIPIVAAAGLLILLASKSSKNPSATPPSPVNPPGPDVIQLQQLWATNPQLYLEVNKALNLPTPPEVVARLRDHLRFNYPILAGALDERLRRSTHPATPRLLEWVNEGKRHYYDKNLTKILVTSMDGYTTFYEHPSPNMADLVLEARGGKTRAEIDKDYRLRYGI